MSDLIEQAKAILRADIEAAKAHGPWPVFYDEPTSHIARQSPDRVIRQAEAMLRLLERAEHVAVSAKTCAGCWALFLARAIVGGDT